ncbi:peptidase S8/S53 domain-containing protein [Blyttiomyces helicus]|uniref:Peptidase S8/S53 domain-containing protein n=1 Tax=Blyttiomyces helicus TaxID=388810 RepID=A0A4V1IR18_9FUNG|nr:peptidase S8/S53 domain-containing protein [Blyttiomyces helicus]|eukprot:RKO88507.1 peptidase S8/S53 domain-containing protein [Blyttiomyces helicus]
MSPAPPSWGLQRISNRDLPLSKTYVYPDSAGANVDAYIIDTGVLIKHPEFQGRARVGKSFTDDGDADGNGHGTHVAGTIGSISYGVAKKVNLIAVKVLDARGSGTISAVLGGIDWVAKEAPKSGRKSVANMSLGGGKSRAMEDAVKAAIKAGVVFAVAAGNSAGDACKVSPAGVAEAITVAASDKNDRLASFSEWGSCVDVIAPGVDITSTWNNGKINTISGTSMASPHVAGVVALALAEGNFSSPAAVEHYLKSVSSKDRITGSLRSTPNNFLYNNVLGSTERIFP